VTQVVTGRLHNAGQPGCNVCREWLRLQKLNGFTFLGLDGCTPNENGLETVDKTTKERLFQE
jgi:hypothetical protein